MPAAPAARRLCLCDQHKPLPCPGVGPAAQGGVDVYKRQVFGQVYQGMDVVDAMACVDTVKDDDGNDTYRPTEEAAITINSVTITTYSSAEDNGLDTVG